eukprot:507605_1
MWIRIDDNEPDLIINRLLSPANVHLKTSPECVEYDDISRVRDYVFGDVDGLFGDSDEASGDCEHSKIQNEYFSHPDCRDILHQFKQRVLSCELDTSKCAAIFYDCVIPPLKSCVQTLRASEQISSEYPLSLAEIRRNNIDTPTLTVLKSPDDTSTPICIISKLKYIITHGFNRLDTVHKAKQYNAAFNRILLRINSIVLNNLYPPLRILPRSEYKKGHFRLNATMPCVPAFSQQELQQVSIRIQLGALDPFTKPSNQCMKDMDALFNCMREMIECDIHVPQSELKYLTFRNTNNSTLRHEYMMRVSPKHGGTTDVDNFVHGNG